MRYKILYYEIITVIELILLDAKAIKEQPPSPDSARRLQVDLNSIVITS